MNIKKTTLKKYLPSFLIVLTWFIIALLCVDMMFYEVSIILSFIVLAYMGEKYNHRLGNCRFTEKRILISLCCIFAIYFLFAFILFLIHII